MSDTLTAQIKNVLPQLFMESNALDGSKVFLGKDVSSPYWTRLATLLGRNDPMDWGFDEKAKQPHIRRRHFYAVRWFNKHGYMESRGSEVWLTPKGVDLFRKQSSEAGSLSVETKVVSTDVDITPQIQNSVQVAQEPALESSNMYDDPYLISLAMAMSSCAGFFSKRSETCSCCPVVVPCSAQLVALESEYANTLRAQERDYFAALAEAEKRKKNPKPEPQNDVKTQFDVSQCDPVTMIFNAHCACCDVLVEQHTKAFWVGNTATMICQTCYDKHK